MGAQPCHLVGNAVLDTMMARAVCENSGQCIYVRSKKWKNKWRSEMRYLEQRRRKERLSLCHDFTSCGMKIRATTRKDAMHMDLEIEIFQKREGPLTSQINGEEMKAFLQSMQNDQLYRQRRRQREKFYIEEQEIYTKGQQGGETWSTGPWLTTEPFAIAIDQIATTIECCCSSAICIIWETKSYCDRLQTTFTPGISSSLTIGS